MLLQKLFHLYRKYEGKCCNSLRWFLDYAESCADILVKLKLRTGSTCEPPLITLQFIHLPVIY